MLTQRDPTLLQRAPAVVHALTRRTPARFDLAVVLVPSWFEERMLAAAGSGHEAKGDRLRCRVTPHAALAGFTSAEDPAAVPNVLRFSKDTLHVLLESTDVPERVLRFSKDTLRDLDETDWAAGVVVAGTPMPPVRVPGRWLGGDPLLEELVGEIVERGRKGGGRKGK